MIGVVTLTGVGFKLSYIITSRRRSHRHPCRTILPAASPTRAALTLLAALAMTGIVCILMGCGIPTTANYIIMVTVAAPTLVQLGVQPLVAHFFVFYYGVLADITPPVALAAYAAAGMAGSRSVQDRQHGFPARSRQGAGAVRVRLLAVDAAGRHTASRWHEFGVTFGGCVLGIAFLSAALSDYFLVRMRHMGTLGLRPQPRS